MLGDFNLIAFLATTDAVRARAFYEDVLGLSFVSEDDFAVVYDAQGIELRLQKVRELTPQPHTALGWSVAGIDRLVRDIAARGGQFQRFRRWSRTPPASGSRRPAPGSPGSATPTAICCR